MKSTNDIIDIIFEEDGILKKKNPLYKKRPSQVEASKCIFNSINEKKHVIFSGPCGTGKSFANIFGSVPHLIDNPDDKIVIVTSSISLQEQLFNKDIPFAIDVFKSIYPNKNINKIIRPAVLKGMSNFVCNARYESYRSFESFYDEKQLKPLELFMNSTKTGDLSDIDFSLSNSIRSEITTDSDNCNSKYCEHEKTCYPNLHKDRARNSNLIVTNYHMLFSSYLAGSSIFSDASIMIFDECHEIESILREFEAKQVTSNTVGYILRKLSELRNKDKYICSPIEKIYSEKLVEVSDRFFEDIKLKYSNELTKSPKVLSSQSELPDSSELTVHLKKIITVMNRIIALTSGNPVEGGEQEFLDIIKESMEGTAENEVSDKREIKDLAKSLKKTCWQMIDMIANVDKLLEDENKVLWVEEDKEDMKIGLKDIDVSSAFREYFLESDSVSCILSSATITVNDNFDYIKRTLGFDSIVNPNKKVVEFSASSPFDLTNQELWYLPSNALPGNHPKFDDEMIPQIAELIKASNGGALCLFTSMKNLNKCKEELPKYLDGHTVLAQGDLSKKKVLEVFRDDFNSSLLATKSFFTGVDIQGNSLRVVIIDKLPFASPADPVQQKLNKRNGAFFNYSLPQMIVELKQAVGRGIRSVDDKCVICILDNRIATARYKNIIFNSMKYKKTSTRDIKDVEKFILENCLER